MNRLAFAVVALAALLHSANSSCETSDVDKTRQDGEKGDAVVLATIDAIKSSRIFPDDFGFLRRMAAVGTNDGERLVLGNGGIWGVSMANFTAADKLMRSTAPRATRVEEKFCFTWSEEVRSYNALDIPLYSALTVLLILSPSTAHPDVIESDDIESQAFIWIRYFNMAGDTALFTEKAEELLETAEAVIAECEITGVDMIFVMDESGSIGIQDFKKMRDLAINITNNFEIGPNDTQVGWISFNTLARVVFNLNSYQDKASLHEAIERVEYRGGLTDIGEGLRVLHDRGFVESAGARNSFAIPEVAIVVTDGISGIGSIHSAAALLRENRNVNVFAIGIGGGVQRAQLEAVASAGISQDLSHVYETSGFVEDELKILQETIRARTCFDVMFLDHESSVENLNVGGLQSIPEGAVIHFNVECPPEGLTINACGREGMTILYISTKGTPSAAEYDRMLEIPEGECRNTFVECLTDASGRRKRQAEGRIHMTVEGVGESNEYELEAMMGDFSTQVSLLCTKDVSDDRQSVVVSCSSERDLTDVKCWINSVPFTSCSLPWKVPLTPPTTEYNLQINVTDSHNFTDSTTLSHTVGPLMMRCSLSMELEIICSFNNQLDIDQTVCSFRGITTEPCLLPHKIDVKGLPLGAHAVHVMATDVFGSTAETTIDYLVVQDRVGDDMEMSVTLDISPIEVGVADPTVSLCYQVHAEEEKFYNLVSDDCVSVNAHVVQPIPHVNSHVIDKIGIRAFNDNGTCYDIMIDRKDCTVSHNLPPDEESITFYKTRDVVHVSVPNCGRPLIDVMHITCTQYNIRNSPTPTEVLEFTTTRGISPIEPAHGLIGQFWGRFMLGQSQTPPPARQRYDKAMTIFDQPQLKRFSGFIHRSWGSAQEQCLYAGDRQGYPVIQGAYSHYEVESLFNTTYRYSRFNIESCSNRNSLLG